MDMRLELLQECTTARGTMPYGPIQTQKTEVPKIGTNTNGLTYT